MLRLVSIKIVAEFLMVKQSTVYSWVHSRSIPFHKLNGLIRFDMDEIEAWVKSSQQKIPDCDLRIEKKPVKDIDSVVRKVIDGVKGNGIIRPTGNQADIRVSERSDNGTI